MRRLLQMQSHVFPESIVTRLNELGWNARHVYLADLRFPDGYIYKSKPTHSDLMMILTWVETQNTTEREVLFDNIVYLCNVKQNSVMAITVMKVDDIARFIIVLNRFQEPDVSCRSWFEKNNLNVKNYIWVNL
jgi:hypothetical protein